MKNITLTLLVFIPMIGISQDWETISIKQTKIKDNVYYLEGRGGNIGVLTGEDGTLIIDNQYAQLTEKIQSAIDEFTENDVSYVINTHYHGDHTGGNENFKNSGATIVAHKLVKERLGTTFENKIRNRTVEAKPQSFWPDIVFKADSSMKHNNEDITFIYAPNAHTDGDVMVYFKNANVIHAGDCFVRYGYPYIDVAAGGSIDGMIAAQKKILAIADENTTIIPGHGKLATIEDVNELLKMLEETKDIVVKAKASGTRLEDLIPQKPFERYHERWNGSFINSDLFVQLIYESI